MPSQYFTGTDYLLSLPILMLTVFALGILLIDLMIPPEWKWTNAVTALIGHSFFRGRSAEDPVRAIRSRKGWAFA